MAGIPKDKHNPNPIKEYPYKKSSYGRKWVQEDGNYKLKEPMIKQIGAMLSLGMAFYQVSDVIGVTAGTFQAWRYKGRIDVEDGNETTLFAKLWLVCQSAKSKGIANVLQGLIKLVAGYEHTETRIKLDGNGKLVSRDEIKKEHAPHLGAIRFFLMNRDPENWAHDRHTEMTLKLANWRDSLEHRLGIDPEELSNEITEDIVALIRSPEDEDIDDDPDTGIQSRSD